MELVRDFPLFPLGMVVLPSEVLPLHIFEERYKKLVSHCLENESEFGVVWLADDGLKPIGCACQISEVLERLPDGRMNVAVQGTRPFRIEGREDRLPFPAGTVEFLEDPPEEIDPEAADAARAAFAELVELATDSRPEPDELLVMDAYEMAATVEFGLDAKQGLLDLRSESARLRLLTRLFRAALKRLEVAEENDERVRSNGHIRLRP
ncbi:MAG: LON peptidase substrate-binding domain-containing protein [Actinomycetota bacterium]|nr:LON peptidase substrate-binding domain-containing protein [Actinomycetota bacterium]